MTALWFGASRPPPVSVHVLASTGRHYLPCLLHHGKVRSKWGNGYKRDFKALAVAVLPGPPARPASPVTAGSARARWRGRGCSCCPLPGAVAPGQLRGCALASSSSLLRKALSNSPAPKGTAARSSHPFTPTACSLWPLSFTDAVLHFLPSRVSPQPRVSPRRAGELSSFPRFPSACTGPGPQQVPRQCGWNA